MNDSIYRISLDIHEHGSQAVLKAKKTDTGRKLHISLRAGGTPYTIDGDCYAVFKATKPDGSILYNACTIENNEIIYEFTEQTCTSVGRCRCEIALYGLDETLITSPRFSLLVDGTIYPDESVESSDEFSALTKLVGETLEAINNASVATGSAIQASENASTAADRANTSAGNADEATRVAWEAAEEAALAARKADGTTDKAILATTDAMVAAGTANVASENANLAAQNANTATDNANLATKNANEAAFKAAHTAKSLMVIGKAEGTAIPLDDAIEQYLVGLRVFGKTTQDGTPTPDAPVELVNTGASGTIKTTVCGANLLPGLTEGKTYTRNGLTLKVYADRCVCSGTPDATYAQVYITSLKETLSKGVYRVAGGQNGDGKVYLQVIVERGGKTTYYVEDKTFQIYGDEDAVRVTIQTGTSTSPVNDYVFYPIVHVGSTPIPYEPYKPQTLTASTPNGLPGIPVTSGGNYTDANGQQRIGDVVDLGMGVRENRTVRFSFAVADMNGSESYPGWRNAGIAKYYPDASNAIGRYGAVAMCNIESNPSENVHINTKEGYDVILIPNPNGMTQTEWKTQYPNLVFELIVSIPDPIVTPLSEEELAAYASLHTYKDHTTVSNDSGAYMELEYAMDAKKYIDGLMAGGIAPATVE